VSEGKLEQLRASYPDIVSFDAGEPGFRKLPAAWLLDQLGWKGRHRGTAAVSGEHALVLINPGQATGEDVYLLAQEMSSNVLDEFGIALQPEVRII
jgi:UDP-N-acetylmuramate dehydrogenase